MSLRELLAKCKRCGRRHFTAESKARCDRWRDIWATMDSIDKINSRRVQKIQISPWPHTANRLLVNGVEYTQKEMKMDNQHQKIKGYRDLSQAEIDLMNQIKAKGAELEELCDQVAMHATEQAAEAFHSGDAEGQKRIDYAQPARWAAMARSDLQTGVMKLVRAVAQPSTF